MFKGRTWHKTVERLNLTPSIVGFDLHLLADDDSQIDKVIALLFPGVCCTPTGLKEELIKCLHKHVEKKKDELYFADWNITLNISSLQDGERIVISRPHLLFSLRDALNGCLRTTLLRDRGKATLWDIRGGRVGGLCDSLQIPRTIGEVKDVCSILLHGNNGQLRYHRFQRPGCPSVREISASYDGQDVGPWGFRRSRPLRCEGDYVYREPEMNGPSHLPISTRDQ
jgi:hypothetical protein